MEFLCRRGRGVKSLADACRCIEEDLRLLSLTKVNVPDEVELNNWLAGQDEAVFLVRIRGERMKGTEVDHIVVLR